MGAFDPLTLGAIGAKFAWICAGLIAIGLSLHALSGVTRLSAAITRTTIALGAAAMALSVLVRFALSAVELAGGVDGAVDLLPVVWSVQRSAVASALIGAGALALGALTGSRFALATGILAAAAAYGLTGHAQSTAQPVLAGLVVALHVILAGFWAAAPLTLWPRKTLADEDIAARNTKVGAIALTAIPVLFLVGGALALWFGGGPTRLIGSAYGAALAVKSLFAVVAVGLGAWNRLSIAKLFASDPAKARDRLRQAMGIDGIVFLGAAFAVALATTVAAPQT